MDSIERAGADLGYEVRGTGSPTVIAQHPLLGNHTFLDSVGLADALVDAGFRVVLPVSIGHKPSSCPRDMERYALPERVADVLAVAEAVGADHFGFLGYSMGSWIGIGLIAAHPDRVEAAALGGWDPIGGIETIGATRELLEASFPAMLPALANDPVLRPMLVEHDAEALTRCALRLFDDALPPLEQLASTDVPVLLYSGADDPYHANVERAANELGAEVVTIKGDHIGALLDPTVVGPVRGFFEVNMTSRNRSGGS